MLIIEVRKNNIDRALKNLRYKVKRVKQLQSLRQGKAFIKKSERRREEVRNAVYKQRWLRENED